MRIVLLVAALLWAGCGPDRSRETVDVFAAASLTDVMEAFADTFEARTNHVIRLNLAGSSLLARQISMGARTDLFVSAHPTWTDYLREQRRLVDVDTLPVSNTLVLVSHGGADLRTVQHLALADPAHVPAGIYAEEALRCTGMWMDVEDKVAPTLDVRSALAAVQAGAAEAAIVYGSDAVFAPELKTVEVFSKDCQPPIVYTVAVLRADGEAAKRFLAMLKDRRMATVWTRHGFRYDAGNAAASAVQPMDAQD